MATFATRKCWTHLINPMNNLPCKLNNICLSSGYCLEIRPDKDKYRPITLNDLPCQASQDSLRLWQGCEQGKEHQGSLRVDLSLCRLRHRHSSTPHQVSYLDDWWSTEWELWRNPDPTPMNPIVTQDRCWYNILKNGYARAKAVPRTHCDLLSAVEKLLPKWVEELFQMVQHSR